MDTQINQSPFDFPSTYTINEYNIEYGNLMEIVQGGPLVGSLYLNGQIVSQNPFGGPILYDREYVYAPMLIRSAFTLTRIKLKDGEFTLIGNSRGIIHLKQLDNNKIYFLDSIYDNSLKTYDLSFFKISNTSDTPTSITESLHLNGHIFRFVNLETLRNESKIGSLYIDNKLIEGQKFGSPFLYNNSQILIPIYIRGLLRSGFRFALINIDDLSIEISGEKEKMIHLVSFENCNKVIYYTDSTQSSKKVVMI